MVIDWTINVTHLGSLIIVLLALGVYKEKFSDMLDDIKEMKEALKQSITDNSLITQTLAVIQQRMLTYEQEQLRSRDVIHKLAAHAQVAIAEHEHRESRQEHRDLRKEI